MLQIINHQNLIKCPPPFQKSLHQLFFTAANLTYERSEIKRARVTLSVPCHSILEQELILACAMIETVLQLHKVQLVEATYFFIEDQHENLILSNVTDMVFEGGDKPVKRDTWFVNERENSQLLLSSVASVLKFKLLGGSSKLSDSLTTSVFQNYINDNRTILAERSQSLICPLCQSQESSILQSSTVEKEPEPFYLLKVLLTLQDPLKLANVRV